jgi:hypothetical protein
LTTKDVLVSVDGIKNLRVSEDEMLTIIFEPKDAETIAGLRKMHTE